MSNEIPELEPLLTLLALWIAKVDLSNAADFFDINKASEGTAMGLLNLIYGHELIEKKKNYPGIDLGDDTKDMVAYQVTSRTDAAKVIKTLKTVVANGDDKIYSNGIRFLIINNGDISFTKKNHPTKVLPEFDEQKDIIYVRNLLPEIRRIYKDDYPTFLRIKTFIERNLRYTAIEAPATSVIDTDAILAALQKQMAAQVENQSKDVAIKTNADLFGLKLPKAAPLSKRPAFIASLNQVLTDASVIWLSGEIGTGKTSTAFLLAEHGITSYWLDISGAVAESIPAVFQQNFLAELGIEPARNILANLDLIFKKLPSGTRIILNDLPDLNGNVGTKRWLTELIDLVISLEIKLIVTSNHLVAPDLAALFSDQMHTATVPPFTESETEEVLALMGATEEKIKNNAQIINYLSEGHPLIVNTIASHLRDKSWNIDEENLESIFKNNYGDQLNNDIYTKLLASTEDEQTRELLFRAKLILGSFTDVEIGIISNVKPAVALADQKVNRIKGTWIQTGQQGTMQLSPLIKRLGNNLNEDMMAAIYRALAKGLLNKKILSPFEAQKAIQYYRNAGDNNEAGFLLVRMLDEFVNKPQLFYDFGINLNWYYSSLPVDMLPFLKVYIRFQQINIALAQKEDTIFLVDDLKKISELEEIGEIAEVLVSMILFRIYASTEPVKSLSYLAKAKDLLDKCEINTVIENGSDFLTNGIWITFYNLKPSEYEDWFAAVKKLHIDSVSLDPRKNESYAIAGPMINNNVAHDAELSKKPEEVEKILLQIIKDAQATGLLLIASYGIKYLIQIYLRDSKNMDKVIELIADHSALLKADPIFHYLILDEYGRQLYYDKQYAEARKQLSNVMDTELPHYFNEQPNTYRIYAILVAKENQRLAHDYTLLALKATEANLFSLDLVKIKLLGELGISSWLIGDLEQAIRYLEQGYSLLHQTFDDSAEYQAAVIRYGSTLNYINELMKTGIAPTEAQGGKYAIPSRGSFYLTNDKLLEGGFYFEERRIFTALVLVDTFEFLGDYEIAKKWALMSIQFTLSLESSQFVIVLTTSLFYLINDGDYKKAFDVFNYINSRWVMDKPHCSTIFQNDLQEVNARVDAVKSDDVIFYQYVITPIVYKIVLDIMQGKLLPTQYDAEISAIFENESLIVNDPETLDTLKRLVRAILIDDISLESLNEILKTITDKYFYFIQVIAYLLIGIRLKAIDAAAVQLMHVKNQEVALSV